MEQDWLYAPERMELREQVLSILLKRFGSELNEDGTPVCTTESIYACAHDWVSQGHPTPSGVVAYFTAYYQ